jgi:hypothetical protein
VAILEELGSGELISMLQYSQNLAADIVNDLLGEFSVSGPCALQPRLSAALVSAHHVPHDKSGVTYESASREASQLLDGHEIKLATGRASDGAPDYLREKLTWRLFAAYQFNLPEHYERLVGTQ